MAHDLRNPLQAIKGAAEFLLAEAPDGAGATQQRPMVQLIADQVERLERVIADYRRPGRVEAVPVSAELNAVVTSVLDGQAVAMPSGIALVRELAADLPRCPLDQDLVAGALENLIRNAREALGDRGVITVRTARVSGDSNLVALAVSDTGPGMDPRLRHEAFGDFFTTKAQGTGLGLAFVRRVAQAHGGDASIRSEEGKGTTVRLRFPAE